MSIGKQRDNSWVIGRQVKKIRILKFIGILISKKFLGILTPSHDILPFPS